MRKICAIAYVAIMFCCCMGCNNNPPIIESTNGNESAMKERLINANKVVAESEDTQINAYIERRGWTMEQLSGGVRLMVKEKGNGRGIEFDESVVLRYSIAALDGTTIYNQVTDTIVMGKNQTTSGMETALKHLTRGSKALVILPSQTAYGVVGDGDRIPTRAVLVVDLECE